MHAIMRGFDALGRSARALFRNGNLYGGLVSLLLLGIPMSASFLVLVRGPAAGPAGKALLIAACGGLLATIWAALVIFGAVFFAADDALAGRDVSVRSHWRDGRARLVPVALFLIVTAFAHAIFRDLTPRVANMNPGWILELLFDIAVFAVLPALLLETNRHGVADRSVAIGLRRFVTSAVAVVSMRLIGLATSLVLVALAEVGPIVNGHNVVRMLAVVLTPLAALAIVAWATVTSVAVYRAEPAPGAVPSAPPLGSAA
ncbi:MAG TPA: hypothetical protein VFR41_11620 [Acidimicrobiia bacterium]|nr:hypothetical protein [Acidimicrobiia bacterium]